MVHLCRACLVAKESFAFVLFMNVSPDVYSFCTSIEVNKDDDLPKTLCNACHKLLEKFSHFKKSCIQSQNTLLFQNNMKLPTDVISQEIYVKCEVNESSDMVVSETNVNDEDSNNGHEDSNNGQEDIINAAGNDKNNAECNQIDISYDYENDGTTHDDEDKPLQKIKKKIKCAINSKKEKKNLQTRIKKKSKVFEYVCGLCKNKFKYKDRYDAHLLEHQGLTVDKTCPVCKKVFQTWSGLQRHADSEHKVVKLNTLRCKECGKVFKNKQTLKLHCKLHEQLEDQTSVCHVCGKSYSSPVTLKLHLEGHNENRARDHPCEHCGKKFFTKHILHSHIKRLHTGQRYICQICNYPFTDKYNLQKHVLKIHQGVKEHKCDICDKFFSTHSTLVIHKRIHSGERPFACTYCGKGFSSKNRQIVHHRTHTGERPHRCTVCNLAFTQLGTMKRHMKTHSKPVAGVQVYRYEKPPDCGTLA